MSVDPRGDAKAVIAHHSKSFALAARLLPAGVAGDAMLLYAYCRRADDALDQTPPGEHPLRLRALHAELDALYGTTTEPLLVALQEVVVRRRIPRAYFGEFLAGLAMDADGVAYATWEDLLRYCYRVAGTVGLMMTHVMGVSRPAALTHAAHLGMAMQLTNISRDVLEDWGRGRLYLPDDVLAECGAPGLRQSLGQPFPQRAPAPVARATAALLERADAYYRSGDQGMRYLTPRCALAVRTARSVYARIGDVLRARGCDPTAARAFVSRRGKLAATARAAAATAIAVVAGRRGAADVPSAGIEDATRVPRLADA